MNARSDAAFVSTVSSTEEADYFNSLTKDSKCELMEILRKKTELVLIRQTAISSLREVWEADKISKHTKSKNLKSNVFSNLLYGSEYGRITESIIQNCEVVQNKSLRRYP